MPDPNFEILNMLGNLSCFYSLLKFLSIKITFFRKSDEIHYSVKQFGSRLVQHFAFDGCSMGSQGSNIFSDFDQTDFNTPSMHIMPTCYLCWKVDSSSYQLPRFLKKLFFTD